MTIRERVSHYLRGANDRSLCSGCIGRALVLGEGQVRHALVLLEGSGRFPRLTGRCSACGSVRLVTRFSVSIAATEPPARAPAPLEPDTLTPETARQAPPEETIQERPKCARCSFVIGVTERIVVSQGDVFHAYCWQAPRGKGRDQPPA